MFEASPPPMWKYSALSLWMKIASGRACRMR
jgi:hypothetical protein